MQWDSSEKHYACMHNIMVINAIRSARLSNYQAGLSQDTHVSTYVMHDCVVRGELPLKAVSHWT